MSFRDAMENSKRLWRVAARLWCRRGAAEPSLAKDPHRHDTVSRRAGGLKVTNELLGRWRRWLICRRDENPPESLVQRFAESEQKPESIVLRLSSSHDESAA